MARFRLSTDILSPLNSDISLNDGSHSAFSFGSLPGTPLFECNFASPICSASTKETDIDLLCSKNMQECVNAFDEITNDVRKQSSLNSDKEEKNKEIYRDLKKSMDDLFGKSSDSSVFSPEFETKSEDLERKMHSKLNAVDELLSSKNQNLTKKNTPSSLENISKAIGKKTEKCKSEKSVTNKPTKNQSKQTSSIKSTKESVKITKNKNEVCVKNNAVMSEKKDSLNDQKKKSKITSKSDGSSFEAKQISPKILPQISPKILPEDKKETVDVRKYNFKCQTKIPVTCNKPINEKKNVSIEKSIHLAVSMEMDHIRRIVLDQNLRRQKDLQIVQEMVKKQNEVTDYLFSVVDELVDTNKKLISKCN